MAVCADRRLPVALRKRLPVNALLKFFGDRVVALSAGRRDVELEDRRLRVFRVENFVRAVTVGTHGSLLRSCGDCVSVDTLGVGGDHLRTLPGVVHDEFLAVASAAGGWNVGMVHARFRIAGRQQFVRTAMAIDAGRGVGVSRLQRLGMKAAIVGSLLVRVAGGAADLLRRRFVRGAGYIRVAVDAGEHAAMN